MIRHDLEGFRNYLELQKLQPRTINEYLRYCNTIELPLTQQFIDTYLQRNNNQMARACVRKLLSYLIRQNPTEQTLRLLDIPKIKGRKKKRLLKVLSEEDVILMAKNAKYQRDYFMIMITFYGGLRLSELLGIKFNSFNWKRWELDQNQSGELNVIGKGNKERTVLLPYWLMGQIKGYIFEYADDIDLEKIFPICDRVWRKIVYDTSLKALGKRINPHLLRHSCATMLLSRGMALEEIKEILGHDSIVTTQIYAHVDINRLKNRYSSLFPTG